ncbi:MAG: tricorn protease [Glaciecola sp.]|jgi:tricorn protease
MHSKKFISVLKLSFILCISINLASFSQGFEGYYNYPTAHNNTLVFSAEGDLWTVSITGGLAQRLTTHAEEELFPKISPDGQTIAFTASYEGPSEVYTMPIDGGLPTRWTYEIKILLYFKKQITSYFVLTKYV